MPLPVAIQVLDRAIAGSLVHHFGYRSGFLFLAAVAAAAFAAPFFYMPETGKPQAVRED
jgi:predicted MFS family arabinose efflux permease